MTLPTFSEFFVEVNGYAPFPWQVRLAAQIETEGFPAALRLPPKSGCSALVDIWVYLLSLEAESPLRSIPRRLFWLYDRKIIASEPSLRARRLATALSEPTTAPLAAIAARLRAMCGEKLPLMATDASGGSYFVEEPWTHPERPAVVVGGVDQILPGLFFRKPGVGFRSLAAQAGLIGNDSLIVLDNPQWSAPALETLGVMRALRNEHPHAGPFHFMSIDSRSGSTGVGEVGLTEADWNDDRLGTRLSAAAPATLVGPKEIVPGLADEARKLRRSGARAIGVFANSVSTARAVFAELEKSGRTVLCTANSRGIDRLGDVSTALSELALAGDHPEIFVVATQALEAGPSVDFDALVTESAPLDTLVQRFGRLNRFGRVNSAPAVIVKGKKDVENEFFPDQERATWRWLSAHAQKKKLDMGISAVVGRLDSDNPGDLFAPTESAPPLNREVVDHWVQTYPRPAVDPEVGYWLHGIHCAPAEVAFVWRADLTVDNRAEWIRCVSSVPPSSAERLFIPLQCAVAWLNGEEPGRIEDYPLPFIGNGEHKESRTAFVLWRGFESIVTTSTFDIRPGDTVVLPTAAGGWEKLSSLRPANGEFDRAEPAQLYSRRLPLIRFVPELLREWPNAAPLRALLKKKGGLMGEQVLQALERSSPPPSLVPVVSAIIAGNSASLYPHPLGRLIVGRRTETDRVPRPLMNDGEEAVPDTLEEHCRTVGELAEEIGRLCGVPDRVAETMRVSGDAHDVGMADPRFQALLRLGCPDNGKLLARSGADSRLVPRSVFQRSRYPRGGRHEVLSASILARYGTLLEGADDPELVQYLVAVHHGRCRPFAPVVYDESPQLVTIQSWRGTRIVVSTDTGLESVGSRLPELFWRLVRRYGHWGLAHLEAIFVAAERRKSTRDVDDGLESAGEATAERPVPNPRLPELTVAADLGPRHVLSGLRGSIPVAFLAALGALRTLVRRGCEAKLSWELGEHSWNPVLHTPLSQEELLEHLEEELRTPPPVGSLEASFNLTVQEYRAFAREHPEWISAFVAERPEPWAMKGVRKSQWILVSNRPCRTFLALAEEVSTDKLRRALFETWTSENGDERQILRLDPAERRNHAKMWADPQTAPPSQTRHGANRLSIEALPLLPVLPTLHGVRTVGFGGNGRVSETMSWPIWVQPLSLDVVRSLLNSAEILGRVDRRALAKRGIAEVFRTTCFADGKSVSLGVAGPA